VLHRYANNEERRIVVGVCQKLRHVVVVLERVACDGSQHEEAQCTTDTTHRLLENAELDSRVRVVEIEWAC
jgi:hypothetical protein